MMYSNKLVASIKSKGKVLREFKDTVYIPFGSKYSFLVKNLHTQRALVNIFIDGENVISGGLVLDPGREVDLERYVKNGNLTEGNRFKFIERTSAIENGPRGVKLEDGLVRIEFQYEAARPVINVSNIFGGNQSPTGFRTSEYRGIVDKFSNRDTTGGWIRASGATYSQVNVNGALRGVDFSNGESVKAQASAAINNYCAQNGIVSKAEVHDGMATMDSFINDVGITVPGSKSNQTFQTTTMGIMEPEKHSIVIKLLGVTAENQTITAPVTVKHKPKCVTCGKQNRAHSKFCTECGTALEIFA